MQYCYVITKEYPNFFGVLIEEDNVSITLEKPHAVMYPDGDMVFNTDFVPLTAEVNYDASFQIKISREQILYTIYMDEEQPMVKNYTSFIASTNLG